MTTFRPKLSDDPKDMEGVLDWVRAEIDKEERQKRDSEEIMERIKPLTIELAKKRGLLTS